MRTSRFIAFSLLGLMAATLICGVATDSLARPPEAALVTLLVAAGAAAAAAGRIRIRSWVAERRAMRLALQSAPDEGLALRLLGDYPPYAIEAARELCESRDSTAVPLLTSALERLMARRPPGWREMAGAIVDSLARIGDVRLIPLLRRLRTLRGAEEIRNLDSAIASLEVAVRLLRPAASPGQRLLLPAGAGKETDSTILLRPSD